MEFQHISVLLEETLDALAVKPDGVYFDGTAGGGGHSAAIAARLTTGRLIAIDRDAAAVAAATGRLAPFPQAEVVRDDFRNLLAVARRCSVTAADGILLDLGVSSHQLDEAARGFSYHADAPLDMRMSGEGLSARDVVNCYSAADLTRILRDYGEERFASRIARAIVEARATTPIERTVELAEIVKTAIPAATRREGGHPAKRSFQAIRIEVNGELEALSIALDDAFSLLAPGGRLAIITFHSLEDAMTKRAFARYLKGCICPPDFPVCVCGRTPQGRLVTRKPVMASSEELAQNNRSRSARLRCIEKQ